MDQKLQVRGTDRRTFLGRAGVAAAGVTALGALPAVARAGAGGITSGDIEILVAAEIAEALAVTTYSNIIDKAPFFAHLASDDQGYIKAALQEEMSHYLLEQSVTGKPSPFTTFYYPPNMFASAQTTPKTVLSGTAIAAISRVIRNACMVFGSLSDVQRCPAPLSNAR